MYKIRKEYFRVSKNEETKRAVTKSDHNLIAHAPIDLNDVHIAVIHYSLREKSIKLGQKFKACVTNSADFISIGLC